MGKKRFKLYQGDNLENLKKLPDNSVDSVVTDPPYGISFMNRKWDYDVPSVELWKEVYRVLKPGGHLLSFGGTRTYHRMVVNIEDAGFEIRDQIMWLYGSGFPKSLNIGKAVDKLQGNERKEICKITKGQSDWEGWGTALKPANEPICVARKPLSEKTVAKNVLKWGTGGINVDGCRIGTTDTYNYKNGPKGNSFSVGKEPDGKRTEPVEMNPEGRFPANLIFECICDEVIKGEKGEPRIGRVGKDCDNGIYEGAGWKKDIEGKWFNDKGDIHTNPDCPCRMLDEQSGVSKSIGNKYEGKDTNTKFPRIGNVGRQKTYADKGGASRFFYQAKVSKKERNMGLDGFEDKEKIGNLSDVVSDSKLKVKNNHPTVKPINLMTYLCRLVTPKNGIVLDPYMGSGSTGISALLEGFRFVGMEMDEEYIKIAESRIENFEKYRELLK